MLEEIKKNKALVLFSGGLDSILAVKTLEEQGIEVGALCFRSNFFNEENARKMAEKMKIKLIIEDISEKLLEIVKNPPSGYGKNLNPCIDCHALMIREAKRIAEEKQYDFLASGEVLGQRPFSQNKRSLEEVKDKSGADILRPLSAKLLEETEIEKNGLVRRGLLYKIQGRRRDGQKELIQKYRIEDFPSPSGGCLLTDPEFSSRMIKILDFWPGCNINDIELLKSGRVFWLNLKDGKELKHILVVVGRHKEDNAKLLNLDQKGDFVLELKEVSGPITLVRGKELEVKDYQKEINIKTPLRMKDIDLNLKNNFKDILIISGFLTAFYASRARGKESKISVIKNE